MTKRSLILNGVLALALCLVAVMSYVTIRSDGTAAVSGEQTVTATTGALDATVSGNGNVEAASDVDVSFQGDGGVVTKIYVEDGERVRRHQPIARIDQTSARQQVRSALAGVASAQASYETTVESQTPQERSSSEANVDVSAASVDSARQQVAAARQSYALSQRQQDSLVDSAERDVDSAENRLASAERTLAAAEQKLDAAERSGDTAAIADARADVRAARSAVRSARSDLSTARDALTTARQTRATTLLQARQQIASSQSTVKSAEASLAAQRATAAVEAQAPREGAVDSARAQIRSAKVALAQARTTLRQTVLRAPVAGTVVAINGVVGESSASSTTDSSSSASSSSDDSSSSGSGSGFVRLSSTSVLEVTAMVAEADIDDVAVGQSADVTFPANDKSVKATVESIDSTQTVTNDVVEYGVTVVLRNPKGVRLGQSADVSITTGSRQNVLKVATSALTTVGTTTTVTVRRDAGDQTVVVTTGLEGDTETEILSGLSEGDVVVVPEQATTGGGFTFPSGGLGGLGGGAP